MYFPPEIKEDTMEEFKDEDLPVLPYRSKNKKIIDVKEYLNEKPENESENKNSVEEIIDKGVIQIENTLNKDIIEPESVVDKDATQVEESINENPIQKEKSESKESNVETEKKQEKEEEPNFDLFNKEYDEMFPL